VKIDVLNKNMHLLIGGNEHELAWVANKMFKSNKLITNTNFLEVNHSSEELFYTSLADLHEDLIIKLAKSAKEIHYYPPQKKELRHHTEIFLKKLSKFHKLTIRNYSVDFDHTNSLSLIDTRKIDKPQLWVAGCSFAYGFGLKNHCDRYIEIISKKLHTDYSDLTKPGSSIEWAADQILRSDIRANDIVIWGITGINRTSYYIDNIEHIIFNLQDKEFFQRLITDDNILNQSVKHLYQVHNYLKKINAKLIILSHVKELSLHEHAVNFEEYLWAINDHVVYCKRTIDTTDDGHPGPLTNRLWANKILKIIENNQWLPI
jgi:hypothetical protein